MSNLILASSELSPQEAIAQLDRVREFVAMETDATVLIEAIDRAKLAETWVKIKSAAGEVAVQATKVQIAAVRRIGQLGSDAIELLPKKDHQYARALARLTDARFETELDNLDRSISPATFYQDIHRVDSHAWDINLGYNIANGMPGEQLSEEQAARLAWQERSRLESLKPKSKKRIEREQRDQAERDRRKQREDNERVQLMDRLLDSLYKEGDPFSLSGAVDSMIDALNHHGSLDEDGEILGPDDPRLTAAYDPSSYVRQGVTEAVRHALKSAASSDSSGHFSVNDEDGNEVHSPRFVTYVDPDAGWVRIPWENASIVQLREMEELRSKQAADLAAKAQSLRTLLVELEKRHDKHPDHTNCAWLLKNARLAASSADRSSRSKKTA